MSIYVGEKRAREAGVQDWDMASILVLSTGFL